MQLRNESTTLEELGVQLIAISTEAPGNLAKSRSKTGATFPFIGDRDGTLLQSLGLLHAGGHPFNKSDIARPATLLIREDGTLAWSSYAENYRIRPSATETLAAIRETL